MSQLQIEKTSDIVEKENSGTYELSSFFFFRDEPRPDRAVEHVEQPVQRTMVNSLVTGIQLRGFFQSAKAGLNTKTKSKTKNIEFIKQLGSMIGPVLRQKGPAQFDDRSCVATKGPYPK
jgi:hypothetical protein